jgi:hypothetical protein
MVGTPPSKYIKEGKIQNVLSGAQRKKYSDGKN